MVTAFVYLPQSHPTTKGLNTPGNFVAHNSYNQVVTRVQQLYYRADTTLLQLLQATKLPGMVYGGF